MEQQNSEKEQSGTGAMSVSESAVQRLVGCGLYQFCEKRECPDNPELPFEWECDHAWEINRGKFVDRVKAEIEDMDLSELNRVSRFIKNQVKAKRQCR